MKDLPSLEEIIKEMKKSGNYQEIREMLGMVIGLQEEFMKYVSSDNYIKNYVQTAGKVYDALRKKFDENKAFELTKQYFDLHFKNGINYNNR